MVAMSASNLLAPATYSPAEHERRNALRRMRTIATGLLVLAAVVFLVTLDHGGWLGFVNAGAEASMVGAIADWFAVTALFRHPLGLPIPHTALIPRKKDELGRGLQEFVASNFLSEEVIRERMASVGVSEKVGEWLAGRSGPGRLTAEQVVDSMLEGIHDWLVAHPEALNAALNQRVPLWVPSVVRDLVNERLHHELVGFVIAVRNDPHHPLREELKKYGDRLAADVERQRRLDQTVADAVVHLVQRYGDDVTAVISHTIERWDGREAADRIELYAGRDLQFIRINGTVVGGLAGLLIHTVAVVVSHV